MASFAAPSRFATKARTTRPSCWCTAAAIPRRPCGTWPMHCLRADTRYRPHYFPVMDEICRAFDAHDADAWYVAVRREFETFARPTSGLGSSDFRWEARCPPVSPRKPGRSMRWSCLALPVHAGRGRSSRSNGAILGTRVSGASYRERTVGVRSIGAGREPWLWSLHQREAFARLQLTAARGFAALPDVPAPTLVMQSTTDNRISTAATQRAFERLGAPDKKLEWIEGAGHVITVDYGWQRVVERTVEWMETHRTQTETGHPRDAPVARQR